jgi:hypothetical protein
MRNLIWLGVVLIALGIAGLIIQNVQYTEKDTVVDLGPLEVQAEEQHNVPIPTIAGVIAILAGVVLVFAARRNA